MAEQTTENAEAAEPASEATSKKEAYSFKYAVFCGKVYDFFATLWRGERKHTPETLLRSRKRGTWIVSFLLLAAIGSFMDDEEEAANQASVNTDRQADAIVLNEEKKTGGEAYETKDSWTESKLDIEKLPGWKKLPKNVDGEVNLRKASSPSFKPVKGNLYIHTGKGLKVGSCDGTDVIAYPYTDPASAFADAMVATALFGADMVAAAGDLSDDDDYNVAIAAREEYATGELVREGVYEYTGIEQYENAFGGTVSLRAFKEIPAGKAKGIIDAVANNCKVLDAENKRRRAAQEAAKEEQRRAQEAAEKAQQQREYEKKEKDLAAYAAKAMTVLNIDIDSFIKKKVFIDKALRPFIKGVKLSPEYKCNRNLFSIREQVKKGEFLKILNTNEYYSKEKIDDFIAQYMAGKSPKHDNYGNLLLTLELSCPRDDFKKRAGFSGIDIVLHEFYRADIAVNPLQWDSNEVYTYYDVVNDGKAELRISIMPGIDYLFVLKHSDKVDNIREEAMQKVGYSKIDLIRSRPEQDGRFKKLQIAYMEDCIKRYSEFAAPL